MSHVLSPVSTVFPINDIHVRKLVYKSLALSHSNTRKFRNILQMLQFQSIKMQFSSSSWCFGFTFLFLTFLLVLFGNPEAIDIKLPGNETFPSVIIFGDSIVDTGNNNNNLNTPARCNFPPYGRDLQGGIPTGRFSNGKVPSDFIVEQLGIKEDLPAYLGQSLQPQDFTYGCGNDFANTYFNTRIRQILHYDIVTYTDLMVNSASALIKEIHGSGARKIGVLNVPPIGCMPSSRILAGGTGEECLENYNEAAQLFNSKLYAELDFLNNHLHLAKVVYLDVYSPLLDLVKNHNKYGFELVDKGCCGTGTMEVSILCNQLDVGTCTNVSNYIFWDSYHLTERAYKLLVYNLLDKNTNSFF
ncbi:hypothetical protein CRYUN_Cryun28dG0109700 [Craigia yunnanensis]